MSSSNQKLDSVCDDCKNVGRFPCDNILGRMKRRESKTKCKFLLKRKPGDLSGLPSPEVKPEEILEKPPREPRKYLVCCPFCKKSFMVIRDER